MERKERRERKERKEEGKKKKEEGRREEKNPSMELCLEHLLYGNLFRLGSLELFGNFDI